MAQKLYTENVWTTLIKMFSFGRMRQEIDQLQQMELSPEVKKSLTKLKQDGDDLKTKLERFCLENPESELCKKGESKSRVRGVVK